MTDRDDFLNKVFGTPPNDGSGETAGWRNSLQRTDKGVPIGNLHNAIIYLRNDPWLMGRLCYDEMSCVALFRPTIPGLSAFGDPVVLTDPHITEIQAYLQEFGLTRINHATVQDAINLVVLDIKQHPICDRIKAEIWDQTPRLETWAISHLGCDDNTYSREVGLRFLISMVARVMHPGCKSDHMIVLEGPQGKRKSSACAVLAEPWFSDHLPDISNGKDAMLHLHGKWLIEVSELDAFSRADNTRLKSFLSTSTDRFRRPYDRYDTSQPRQCVFVGTSNTNHYLRDHTGGRRFWPLKVGAIDLDGIERDRWQLFAEAYLRYCGGELWWPSQDLEQEYFQPKQEDRQEQDVWFDIVECFLRGKNKVKIPEIATNALALPIGHVAAMDGRRIAAILETLGWVSKRNKHDRWWEKG